VPWDARTRCYAAGMPKFVAGLVVFGAFVLVNIVGALAFLVAGKLALHLDPAANESHFSGFIVAITGVAVASGPRFPSSAAECRG